MFFTIKTNDETMSAEKKWDLSTDTDDKGNCETPCPRNRRSMGHENEFYYYEVPVTPDSNLFLHPTESPGYKQLNQRLADLYRKFEIEIEPAKKNDCNEKTINVQNTACSSLMQRRNKSQRPVRCHDFL